MVGNVTTTIALLNADQMQSMSSAYKPSPLGYGSQQRSSPFRRPQSPASPASPSTLRQSTPTTSPTKQGYTDAGATYVRSPVSPTQEFRTPRRQATVEDTSSEASFSQQRSTPRPAVASAAGHGSALSQLQPSQARTMRESFQLLDRDSDGVVKREDVVDMLNQLGRIPFSAVLISCRCTADKTFQGYPRTRRTSRSSSRRQRLKT